MRAGALAAFAQLVSLAPGAHAQTDSQLPTVSKECGEIAAADTPLPHGATALRERKQLKILAIGSSSASMLGGTRDAMPLLEQILAPALRSRNPDRRREAVEALENLAAIASHLKHLLLIRDLRRLSGQ